MKKFIILFTGLFSISALASECNFLENGKKLTIQNTKLNKEARRSYERVPNFYEDKKVNAQIAMKNEVNFLLDTGIGKYSKQANAYNVKLDAQSNLSAIMSKDIIVGFVKFPTKVLEDFKLLPNNLKNKKEVCLSVIYQTQKDIYGIRDIEFFVVSKESNKLKLNNLRNFNTYGASIRTKPKVNSLEVIL
jgi:hypothetical protein